jgi:RNA polymerase sigma factor (sigma-70 family)
MPDVAHSNERLLQRASKGDQRAFASIFERYHQRLYRYCAAIVGDPEDARDALQNTMVRVLAALPGERRKLELEPWLYRVAHNEAIDVLRRRRPTVDVDSVELAGTTGPEADLETRNRLQRLIADLRELPERQRGALVMRELSGLSFEQIGEAFETSGRTARQTVYEARVSLQDMEGGRAMPCDDVRQKLSDGDRRLIRRRDVRAHLRQCAGCREFERSIAGRREELGAIAPLSVLAAGGVAKALLGGAAGSAAGPGTGAAGAGTIGQAIGGSVLAKTIATGAVVAAIGVGAADRSGLIHVLPRDGGSASTKSSAPEGTGAGPASSGGGSGSASGSGGAGGPGSAQRDQRASATDSGPGSDSATGARKAHNSRGNAGAPPAGNKAQGAGAANAHGANPNANEHAATKSNNGRAVGKSGSKEHAPQHGAPANPNSKPHQEPAAKPAPPAKGQSAGAEAPGKSGQATGKSGEAVE